MYDKKVQDKALSEGLKNYPKNVVGYTTTLFDPKAEIDGNEGKRVLFMHGYMESSQEYESLPKIHGWVARDKDGSVRLFEKKPEWTHNRWEGHHFYLGGEKFGIDVKRAEPVEVELLIRKIEFTKQV